MKFVVRTTHLGQDYWLRATVWSRYPDRATPYDSHEDAKAALEKAKPFMKHAAYKAATIEEMEIE
jgi:hypothetical protein